MPRADSKHPSSQYYAHYLPDSASPSPQPSPPQPSHSSAPPQKKKHVCSVCDRPFSTSGHLARHSRVHTGERNHKCPFPGCETRCSRQDNLQQHYRIHLSPGSRRSSTRSAISRAMNSSAGAPKRNNSASSTVDPPMSPPPLSSPPALEPARVYNQHSPPPDSPPPLAQATLPATAHLPSTSSSRSSSSPEATYPSGSHNLVTISSQGPSQGSQSYSYRNNTSTYHDQSQGAGYTYVHTTPLPHPSSSSNASSFSSYSNPHNNFGNSLPNINTSSPVLQHPHDSPNPTPISSRHSISHISHPQSYPQNQSSSAEPASPASSHSPTSGPTTPSYVYHDDPHGYHHHHGNAIVNDHSSLSNGHLPHHQTSYPSSVVGVPSHQRFDSPPPILAPIQEHRYNRRDDRHSDSHSSASYLHHNSQSMSNDYQYHQSITLGHGPWKSESGIRKGLGALVQ